MCRALRMGTVCARCSEVKKGNGEGQPGIHPDLEESEEGEESEGRSEIAASSDEDDNHEDKKQDVKDILKKTGDDLKRGKTMAMKEAISTAKKIGLEASTISEAEKRLDEHKKQQRREEVEQEVTAFFASPAHKEIAICQKMLKKAQESDCKEAVLTRLQQWLDELIITRDLEEDEVDQARDYLKSSCRDFVVKATQGGGRPVTFLKLDNGQKVSACLYLDPPLQSICLKEDSSGPESAGVCAPVSSLQAVLAARDQTVSCKRAFTDMEENDTECAVALRYENDGMSGVWCLVEPTIIRRDRLIESIIILRTACGG